jgi:hypothetical protein
VADALSRHPLIDVAEVLAIIVGTPEWLKEIMATYATDTVTQHLLRQMAQSANKPKHPCWDGDLLLFKHRILVGGSKVMRSKILQTMHSGV